MSDLRPVLIATPFFAPQSHAAVFRAYKLAKLLPRHGYRPIVITVDTNYDYHEDAALLANLPAEVRVIRASHVEPTLRGLEFALGLRDRRAAAARGIREESTAPRAGVQKRRGVLGGVRQLLMGGLLRIPDRHWTWLLPALNASRKVIREEGIELVMTSSDPFTSYLLGMALQRDGLRWVADLRDPATHCALMHSSYPWVFAIQREIERRGLERADAVTVAARSIASTLSEFHNLDLGQKAHFIPTGLDSSLLEGELGASRAGNERCIVFAGEYLEYYGDKFFRCFAQARADPRILALGYRVVVVGRSDVNRRTLAPILEAHQLGDAVTFVEHMDQTRLYALLRTSAFGLLPYGEHRWWCLAAKLVDFLALRKPVLAIVPDPSEARSRLNEARLGIFLDGDDERATSALVKALLQGPEGCLPDVDVCRRYLAEEQVRAFAAVFDSVLDDARHGANIQL